MSAAMSLYRAVCQKLAPFARKSAATLSKNVRSVAYGLPGGSGKNVTFVVLCGGSIMAAAVYAYKTRISDSEKPAGSGKVAELNARPKDPCEVTQVPVNRVEDVVEAKEEIPKSQSLGTGEVESMTTGIVAEVTAEAPEAAADTVALGAEATEVPALKVAPTPADSKDMMPTQGEGGPPDGDGTTPTQQEGGAPDSNRISHTLEEGGALDCNKITPTQEEGGPPDSDGTTPAQEEGGPPDSEGTTPAEEEDGPSNSDGTTPAQEEGGPPDSDGTTPAQEEGGLPDSDGTTPAQEEGGPPDSDGTTPAQEEGGLPDSDGTTPAQEEGGPPAEMAPSEAPKIDTVSAEES